MSRRDALDELHMAAVAFPEQRIAQIVVNAVGTDPFYVEDAALADALRRLRARREESA